jgi:hypothetical protein
MATTPHYVRCVKPNKMKSPSLFDARMILDQLLYRSGALVTLCDLAVCLLLSFAAGAVIVFLLVCRQCGCSGVLETVRIRRQGFPFREDYPVFWRHCWRSKYLSLVHGIEKLAPIDPNIPIEGTVHPATWRGVFRRWRMRRLSHALTGVILLVTSRRVWWFVCGQRCRLTSRSSPCASRLCRRSLRRSLTRECACVVAACCACARW